MLNLCPVCGSGFTITGDGAPCQPCRACWANLTPAARAPFLRTLRAHGGPFIHRDPTRHAPPTLAAYVAHLERELEKTR
jgi:hypothetical protein